MYEICRICLKVGQLISIFNDTDPLQISAKIMSFASVKVVRGDNLPASVCLYCAKRVDEIYEFKKQCEESDIKLRLKFSVAANSEVVVKNEVDYLHSSFPKHSVKSDSESDCKLSTIGVKAKCLSVITKCPELSVNSESKADCTLSTVKVKPECPSVESKDNKLSINKSETEFRRVKRKPKQDIEKKNPKARHKKKICKRRVSVGSDDSEIYCSDDFANSVNNYCGESDVDYVVAKNTEKCKSKKEGVEVKKKKSSKPQKEQCFTCGKVMSSRFRLKMHMRTHTGERPYSCDYCPKKFALSQNLKVHERVHTGIKPLVCATCGRAFAQSAGLVAHMRLHTGETPYKCVLCPLAFRTPGHLQYHVSRQHTGEKRHICNVCTRAFITRGDLTQHSRTHSGERPHVCSTCGLRLGRASHLARHMLTHTGAKPHPCQMCSATYAQRGDLARHMKRHSHFAAESGTQESLQKTVA